MKFAFMILGPFDMERDRAVIKNGNAQIVGVRNLDAACEMAKRLQAEGVDCLDLVTGAQYTPWIAEALTGLELGISACFIKGQYAKFDKLRKFAIFEGENIELAECLAKYEKKPPFARWLLILVECN